MLRAGQRECTFFTKKTGSLPIRCFDVDTEFDYVHDRAKDEVEFLSRDYPNKSHTVYVMECASVIPHKGAAKLDNWVPVYDEQLGYEGDGGVANRGWFALVPDHELEEFKKLVPDHWMHSMYFSKSSR